MENLFYEIISAVKEWSAKFSAEFGDKMDFETLIDRDDIFRWEFRCKKPFIFGIVLIEPEPGFAPYRYVCFEAYDKKDNYYTWFDSKDDGVEDVIRNIDEIIRKLALQKDKHT